MALVAFDLKHHLHTNQPEKLEIDRVDRRISVAVNIAN